jgi:hypothetical protein
VQRLQRSAPVLDIIAAMIPHRFVGRNTVDWRGRRDILTPQQPAQPADVPDIQIEDGDHALLELLARDGRTSYAVLARATGMSLGRALDGVHSFELSPVLRRLEQAGALTVGDRLAQPTPAPTRRRR